MPIPAVNTETLKESIKTNVYLIPADRVVPLHQHKEQDELFYVMDGSGYGVLTDEEKVLERGDVFVVPAGTMHALRSDHYLLVSSFLVPVVHNTANVTNE